MTHRVATMERAEISRISRQGFIDDPGGPSVLVLVERRRTRKEARTAASATDITRYRFAGGAICRLITVIRWFSDYTAKWFRETKTVTSTRVRRSSRLAERLPVSYFRSKDVTRLNCPLP